MKQQELRNIWKCVNKATCAKIHDPTLNLLDLKTLKKDQRERKKMYVYIYSTYIEKITIETPTNKKEKQDW